MGTNLIVNMTWPAMSANVLVKMSSMVNLKKLDLENVSYQGAPVLFKLRHEDADVKKGVGANAEGKVICRCQNFDAVREVLVPLSTHIFLECGGSRSATVDFAIEKRREEHAFAEGVNEWPHDFRGVSPRKGPAHVARRVANVRADAAPKKDRTIAR